MIWIEQIRVRSAEFVTASIIEQTRRVIASIKEIDQVIFADVFRHKDYTNDFVAVIQWKSQEAPQKSDIGRHLASYLQGFGLVEHSVWINQSEELRRVS